MNINPSTRHNRRPDRVYARVRQRQLELARLGRVADSARYADLANRVRRTALLLGLAGPRTQTIAM